MKEAIETKQNSKSVEKVSENELAKLREEVEKVKMREEEVIYKISHDLQQPITTMIGYLGLIERRYIDSFDDKGKVFLENIKLSSEKLSIILKGLLEYSRVGKAAQQESVDCEKLVFEIWEDLTKASSFSNAELVTKGLPVISANPFDLHRLFFHVIQNALIYQNPGSKAKVEISSESLEGGWKFEVKDNGIGIASQYGEEIFELLTRLNNADFPGAGLGLSICKRIIESCQGEIWVESEEGKGSSFYFTIFS
ncbi:MAG: ATP-binding protein [Bacteroidota bacterium]